MDLDDQALLQLEGKPPNRTIRLHDLLFDYLRARQQNPRELHGQMVEAYRAACSRKWTNGPDDGYFLFHIGHHLVEAGLHDELTALLHNFAWLMRSLQAAGASRVLSDFDLLPNGSGSRVRRAIHQSAPVLSSDPSQLAGQLLGRLGGDDDDPAVAPLLERARGWRGAPWLRPVRSSLLSPESPLSLVLSGHEGRIRTLACSPDGQILVTAGNSHPDQTVRVWDLERGVELHCLEKQAPEGLTPLAFAHDNEHFLSAVGNEIRIWEWRSGKRVRTVRGHDAPIVVAALLLARSQRHDFCAGGQSGSRSAMVALLLARPHCACVGLRARNAACNFYNRPTTTPRGSLSRWTNLCGWPGPCGLLHILRLE